MERQLFGGAVLCSLPATWVVRPPPRGSTAGSTHEESH